MRTAKNIVATAAWGWSAQVTAEFINVSTSVRRKYPWPRMKVRRALRSWLKFPILPITGELVLEALRLGERFQISHYDAQIVAAAKALGCATLYSEDLSDRQQYDGVTVVNPFRAR